MSANNSEKRRALEELLERGATQIVVNPHHEEARLPAAFGEQLLVRLNISHRFSDSDLKVDWWGVRQTLTFGAGRAPCHVPWEAIFAMGDPGRLEGHHVWPGDAPENLQRELKVLLHLAGLRRSAPDSAAAAAATRPPAAPWGSAATRAFTPRVIEGEGGGVARAEADARDAPEAGELDDEDDPKPPSGGGRPILRVVK